MSFVAARTPPNVVLQNSRNDGKGLTYAADPVICRANSWRGSLKLGNGREPNFDHVYSSRINEGMPVKPSQDSLIEHEHRSTLHTSPDRSRSHPTKQALDSLTLVYQLQSNKNGRGVDFNSCVLFQGRGRRRSRDAPCLLFH
jgi:hypothetical protein